MRRSPRWFRRTVALAAMFAWVLALSVGVVHRFVVEHPRCAEHGEELEQATARVHTDAETHHDEQAFRGDASHSHECPFDTASTPVPRFDVPHPAPVLASFHVDEPSQFAPVPRGPPLSYAPKHGPPSPTV